MINNDVRLLTKKWLKSQPFTVVAYWGKSQCDLWEVLDIYAHAKMDKESVEDALCDAFPETADDIQVTAINHGEYSTSSMLEQFSNCLNKIVFWQDEQINFPEI